MKSALTIIPLALAVALLLPGNASAQRYRSQGGRSHGSSFSISLGFGNSAPSCGNYGYAPVVYQPPVSYYSGTYYAPSRYQQTYYQPSCNQPTYYAPSYGHSHSYRGRGRYR